MLPYYRGLDSHRWAILNDDLSNIGSTLHWVNAGVDTGPIIAVKRHTLKGAVDTDWIEFDLFGHCVDLLVSAAKNPPGKGTAQAVGKQHYKMNSKLIRLTEYKLATMAASR